MDDVLFYVWLSSIRGLTAKKKLYLLELFQSARAIYEADDVQLCQIFDTHGPFKHTRNGLSELCDKSMDSALAAVKGAEAVGAGLLPFGDPLYPKQLTTVQDAPILLYYMGDLSLIQQPCIAIVGTRKSSPYGRWAAFEIGKRVAAAGVPVVSGMADGIDSAAHEGCLSGGKGTVAVFGTGIDICFPASNRRLCQRIARDGLLLTEYSPGEKGVKSYFPERNRIISGLCKGVVIVEGAIRSGSMITAGLALEQGRDVYAVPGNINQPNSVGVNKLIFEGATPIMDLDRVGETLGIRSTRRKESRVELLPVERAVMDVVRRAGSASVSDIIESTGLNPKEAIVVSSSLELKGLILSDGSKFYVAK